MADTQPAVTTASIQPTVADSRWWFGLMLVGVIAYAAVWLGQQPWLVQLNLSPLTLGIVLGIVAGNSLFPYIASRSGVGVDYAKSWLLKAGVVLFGFRITFSQVASVGWQGLLADVIMLSATFLLTLWLAKKVFKLDLHTAILIGAGSSICGAAAIMATEPVLKAQAHKVSVAVATVVVFGTLSLFLYPLAFPMLGLSEHSYGIFAGSTIHEVAQVVAAGSAVSEHAATIAVITKMLRVMLLAPFLILLALWLSRKHSTQQAGQPAVQKVFIPWFALCFILASGINSLGIMPAVATHSLLQLDNILLTMAMVALGLRTQLSAIRQAGIKPLLLAGCLFAFLTLGGFVVNSVLAQL